ncbi:MAG: 1-acyl-sn-glycerol-3-phosphate acyltransferase [Burkholderiaceae bacterium]|nr:1-acyl-sn-glycerol-3-phosphate acyltransferase [Burkholderiaceae bacterium]
MRLFDRLYGFGLRLIAPITIAAALVHVALGLLYALLTFSWIGRRRRDSAIMTWSRILLLIIGVRPQSFGEPPRPGGTQDTDESPGSLLLANHTSWLEVFSIAAVVPARFVSKSEIARWPVFGWLAIAVGTLFVERGRRHAVARANQAVAERLRSGQLIAVFPEGTTTDGSRLLPFHANLVQPALDIQAPIRPVGVRFTQRGAVSRAAMYIDDMNVMQSLWRIVTAPHLTVELHWLPPIDPPRGRHEAARSARAAIAQALQLSLEEQEVSGEVGAVDEPSDAEPGSAPAG